MITSSVEEATKFPNFLTLQLHYCGERVIPKPKMQTSWVWVYLASFFGEVLSKIAHGKVRALYLHYYLTG